MAFDWRNTVLSQWAASPVIVALLDYWSQDLDPSAEVDGFVEQVWDVLTAGTYGLDVWGRIVGVSRYLDLPGGVYFGFSEAQPDLNQNTFGFGSFWSGERASSKVPLANDAFRVLILAKALSNISRTSIPVYNQILARLFPDRGLAYVTDTGQMSMRFTFEFALKPYELAIVQQTGVLAPPTGVRSNVMVVPVPRTFGFNEAGRSAQSFGHGQFFGGFS